MGVVNEEAQAVAAAVFKANQPWCQQANLTMASVFGHIQRNTLDEVAEMARGKAGDGYDLLSFAELLSPSPVEEATEETEESEPVVDGRG